MAPKGMPFGAIYNLWSVDVILVLAARAKNSQNHQIGMAEKPLIGLVSGGLGGTHQESQMAASRQGMQVFQADSGQPGNFLFGEDLLARLNGHDSTSLFPGITLRLFGVRQVHTT